MNGQATIMDETGLARIHRTLDEKPAVYSTAKHTLTHPPSHNKFVEYTWPPFRLLECSANPFKTFDSLYVEHTL